MCGAPIQLNGNVLAAYLSKYGEVDEVTLVRSPAGTVHSDYIINMCLNQEGVQAIPHIIKFKDQNMMVIVKGRRSSAGHASNWGTSPDPALKQPKCQTHHQQQIQ